jgi:hypothetical protein
LSAKDRAVLAAQHLAGNAAVADRLGERAPVGDPAAATSTSMTTTADPGTAAHRQPPLLALDAPHIDLALPLGAFDHLLKKGRRLQRHTEILERFDRQSGEVPVTWRAATGATTDQPKTRWTARRRTFVATSHLQQFAAVSGSRPSRPGSVTDADALLAGLPRRPLHAHGSVRLRYGGQPVVAGPARVKTRIPDDATLVVEFAFAAGTLTLTGHRDVQHGEFDWDTDLRIDLDDLARVLWRDVFDRLETRRRAGLRKLKSYGAPTPSKKRTSDPSDDEDERLRSEDATDQDPRHDDDHR